jgi:hypothetical protein
MSHRSDVGWRVAPGRGGAAEEDSHHGREEERVEGQLDRHREPLHEHVRDGPVEADRRAEVARQQVADVLHVLDEDGLVQAVADVERVADLIGRLLAEGRPARVARDDPGEDEDERDHPEKDRDGEQHASDDEAAHAAVRARREGGERRGRRTCGAPVELQAG